MISAVVCLNTLLNTEWRPINMDNIEHKPDTSIEQQHETGRTSPSRNRQLINRSSSHTATAQSRTNTLQPKTESESQQVSKLSQRETENLRTTSSAGVQPTPQQPKTDPEPQNVTESELEDQNVKKIELALDKDRKVHPKTVQDELPEKSSKLVKWVVRGIIAAAAIIGMIKGYEYIRPAQKRTIDSLPTTVSTEVTKPDYAKLSEEIFTSLQNSFVEFVNAGAVEDYGFCENENDLLQEWRGRKIFMFTGSRAGFIDTDKFSEAFSNALQASTLEKNDAGTVFQADLSGTSEFRTDTLIDSAITLAGSLKTDKFSYTQDMKRTIIDDITRRLETNGTHGYVRFILRTNNEGAKLMAAYSLNPSDASQKTYLVLRDSFMGFDGRTLRNIEDSINVMSDINAVSFTMRKGRVESYDSLTDCLCKFVNSFAK